MRIFRYRLSPETFGYTLVYIYVLSAWKWRNVGIITKVGLILGAGGFLEPRSALTLLYECFSSAVTT